MLSNVACLSPCSHIMAFNLGIFSEGRCEERKRINNFGVICPEYDIRSWARRATPASNDGRFFEGSIPKMI
ncbi:MAG: hypothetical protein DRJ45_04625 [Thermoprotei archaeon]|nr:MAG: hypothetical protein DRJ45_04625 [Thermoprotei archaeon]